VIYIRRMDDPHLDGASADCWFNGVGNLNVHYSSGVGNHFFYLLSEGLGAKTINGIAYNSPTCNGSTIKGIGHDKAAAIWYKALTEQWVSTTNYHNARVGTLNAAKDLFGVGSVEYKRVNRAWGGGEGHAVAPHNRIEVRDGVPVPPGAGTPRAFRS
jgi:zinc metalloprotease ZmpA